MGTTVSEIFDPAAWRPVEGFDLTDVTYHRAVDAGVVRVALDRPEVRNAPGPTPSTSCTGSSTTPGSRPTSAACC